MVARRNFKLPKRAKTQYFRTKTQKTQKMLIICQKDWRDVGWLLSCNAFAISSCFVNCLRLTNWTCRIDASNNAETRLYCRIVKCRIHDRLKVQAAHEVLDSGHSFGQDDVKTNF